ncbi:MAG: DUF3300 domain-containing protein [Candidatus Acidiferrales bacterium]
MTVFRYMKKTCNSVMAVVICLSLVVAALAQDQAPPSFTPDQLDHIVSRIALYPDPLLAQVLTASTFPDQIPDAAQWADEHHYLTGQELADAIQQDQLPWDPSVQALLPFPSVLGTMASDAGWTNDLGNAVLGDRDAVMNAVQRMRKEAMDYGYLRSNAQIVVSGGPYIGIEPANPAFIVVPAYDPVVVYVPPRPGFFVGGAIGFGFGVTIGAWFHPWGWGTSRIVWGSHAIFINNARWDRNWANRRVYVHPYPGVHRYTATNHAVEHHELVHRSEAERNAAQHGQAAHEEHHEQHHEDKPHH